MICHRRLKIVTYVNVTITTDEVTGERRFAAVAVNGIIPEHNNLIRIKDYRQTWTIKPTAIERTHVILEGYVDPAGAVPDWMSNMLIIETPLKAINSLRERMARSE